MPTVTERPESTDSVDARLIRNVTRIFDLVNTTRLSAVAASLAFSTASGVLINSVHPDLSTLFCSSIGATETATSAEPHCHYSITATYTNNFDSGGEGTSGGGGSAGGATAGQQQGVAPADRQSNPVLRQVDVKVDGQTQQVSLRQDSFGDVYTNTAGDPILPAPQRSVPGVKITIGRNFLLCPGNLFQYLGQINNAAITIPIANLAYPAFGLRFATLSAEPVFESGIVYWRVNFTLEQGPYKLYGFDNKYLGWRVPLASMGRRGITNENLKTHVLTDGELAVNEQGPKVGTGQPMAEPVFLDQFGRYILPGAKGENIHYKVFQPDLSFNMAVLFS